MGGPSFLRAQGCTGASWCLPPPCPLLRRHLVHHSCPCDDRLAFTRTHPAGPARRGLAELSLQGFPGLTTWPPGQLSCGRARRGRQPVRVSSTSPRASGQESLMRGLSPRSPHSCPSRQKPRWDAPSNHFLSSSSQVQGVEDPHCFSSASFSLF